MSKVAICQKTVKEFCYFFQIPFDTTNGIFIRAFTDKGNEKKPVLKCIHTDTLESWEYLASLHASCYGLHTPINKFEGDGPRAATMTALRAFAVDYDTEDDWAEGLATFVAPPTLITRRSNSKRGHALWVFEMPVEISLIKNWSDLQKRLARATGGQASDMQALSTLIRLPGTGHFKDGIASHYGIVGGTKQVYDGLMLATNFDCFLPTVAPSMKTTIADLKGSNKPIFNSPDSALANYLSSNPPPDNDGLNTYLFRVSAKAHGLGVDEEVARAMITKTAAKSTRWKLADPETIIEYRTAITNAYHYAKNDFGSEVGRLSPELGRSEEIDNLLQKSEKGVIKRSYYNVSILIRNIPFFKKLYRFNEFSERTEITRDTNGYYPRMATLQLRDEDILGFKRYLSESCSLEATSATVHEAIYESALLNSYNPLKDWLLGLEWDEVPRLESWLSTYCNAEYSPYTRWCGTSFLVAAVARIFEPGKKYDHFLVLEGEEGAGKSTVFSILGGPYFGDCVFSRNGNDKDSMAILDQKWIIEFSELSNMNRMDQEVLKGFISRQYAEYRMPYGRLSHTIHRKYVMGGTTNKSHYLSAMDGNRRFLPVRVHDIELTKLEEDRRNLFAEAYVFYKKDFKLFIPPELRHDFKDRQNDSRLPDEWEGRIGEYILAHPEKRWSTAELWTGALGGHIGTMSMPDAKRMCAVLSYFGCMKTKVMTAQGRRIRWGISIKNLEKLKDIAF